MTDLIQGNRHGSSKLMILRCSVHELQNEIGAALGEEIAQEINLQLQIHHTSHAKLGGFFQSGMR